MKKYLDDYNQGKIDKSTLQKKLLELQKKAKALVERSKNAKQSAEKSVVESTEYRDSVIECFYEFVSNESLEFIDTDHAFDIWTEEY